MSGGKEWMAGAVPMLVFLALFLLARSNPSLAFIFLGLQSLFSLGVAISLLVVAFGDSAGQGFLCLCLPFYALYFVYVRQNSPLLKWAFGSSIFAIALAGALRAGN